MNNFDIFLIYYHGEEFVEEQVESIKREMINGDHLFILNDSPTPNSINMLNTLTASDVTILTNKENLGFNKNVMQCRYHGRNTYIVFSDQDDIWLPGRLGRIRDQSFDICAVGYDFLVNGERISRKNSKNMTVFNTFFLPVFPGCTLCVSRHFLNSLKFGNRTIKSIYDQYLLCKAVLWGYKSSVVPEALILYRRHENTQTDSYGRIPNGIVAALSRRLVLVYDLIVR